MTTVFHEAALALDAEIARQLTTLMTRLAAEGIPPSIIAHTMLRLACATIRDTEGKPQLLRSIETNLGVLTDPTLPGH